MTVIRKAPVKIQVKLEKKITIDMMHKLTEALKIESQNYYKIQMHKTKSPQDYFNFASFDAYLNKIKKTSCYFIKYVEQENTHDYIWYTFLDFCYILRSLQSVQYDIEKIKDPFDDATAKSVNLLSEVISFINDIDVQRIKIKPDEYVFYILMREIKDINLIQEIYDHKRFAYYTYSHSKDYKPYKDNISGLLGSYGGRIFKAGHENFINALESAKKDLELYKDSCKQSRVEKIDVAIDIIKEVIKNKGTFIQYVRY